jgi:molybdenum cofactor guanylyltransferase
VTKNAQPIGVILAGGVGLRIGGAKPSVALRGQALIRYPLDAMKLAVSDVAVITKATIVLPSLEGVMIWIEPDVPDHPLLGICEALALAGGRSVLVCPVDLPFVTPELLTALAGARPAGLKAVVAAYRGVPQPLLGCYQPVAAPLLAKAAQRGASLEDAMRSLRPALLEVHDETQLFDVDTPDDLLQASAMLGVSTAAPSAQPNVKS